MERYKQGDMKAIHFYSPEAIDGLRRNELHTLFSFEEECKVKLKEPINITIGDIKNPRFFGTAEIVSIKQCTIGMISEEDYKRQQYGLKNRRDTLEFFRAIKPENRAEINTSTPIVVITFRRHDYSLKRLNNIVKTVDKPRIIKDRSIQR